MKIFHNFGTYLWSKHSFSSHLVVFLLFTQALVVQSCGPKMTSRGRAKKAVGASENKNSTQKYATDADPSVNPSDANATANNLAAEIREKRQLFRGDIPEYRPLTGNHYALEHGFPLPGRFNEEQGNSIQDEGQGLVQYQPGVLAHAITYQHEEQPAEISGPAYKTVSHGNEIVHQYPVEVSQIIQLGTDLPKSPPHPDAHAPPKVHPDQNPEPHPLKHQIRPEEPADLIVREPNGEPEHVEEPFPEIQPHIEPIEPIIEPYPNYVNYAHNYGYQPNPYRLLGPYSGAYKIAQFFRNWPSFVRKMAYRRPYRRYRPKINHHHYI